MKWCVFLIFAMTGMLWLDGPSSASAEEPYLFEIYSQGQKYRSLRDYRMSSLKGKTITISPDGTLKEEKAGADGLPIPADQLPLDGDPGDMSPQDRVAGISPSFEDLAQGLYGQDVPLKQVASSDDMFTDLRQRLLGSDAPVLIISDHKKTRVLRLDEGRSGSQESRGALSEASGVIISP